MNRFMGFESMVDVRGKAYHPASRIGVGISAALFLIPLLLLVLSPGQAGATAGTQLPPLAPMAPLGVGSRVADEPAADAGRPLEILSWRHQILSRDAYRELAKQWEEYVASHPDDPRAWVEWGDALRYAGAQKEGEEKYARAFAIDSMDVMAILSHAFWNVHDKGDGPWQLAHRRLLRAASTDPNVCGVYYGLWTTALRSGDETLAAECLRRMVALDDMPRPLLDWGYNLVAGAPQGAIIFTNGDNDTYPPLAYQVLSSRRQDVAIVNLSLLNTRWYIRYWRDRGLPITLDDEAIDALKFTKKRMVSDQVQEHLFQNLKRGGWSRSLFYCVTVMEDRKILPCNLVLEGLLERIVPAGEGDVRAKETHWARLKDCFDTVYRLDSALDPYIDWEREAAIGHITTNYAALLRRLGEWLATSRSPAEAGPYLYRAVEILAFHGRKEHANHLVQWWAQQDPQARLLPYARTLLE